VMEGLDGAGLSTQAALLARYLRSEIFCIISDSYTKNSYIRFSLSYSK